MTKKSIIIIFILTVSFISSQFLTEDSNQNQAFNGGFNRQPNTNNPNQEYRTNEAFSTSTNKKEENKRKGIETAVKVLDSLSSLFGIVQNNFLKPK